jgi:DmsE family decaheme c-type cytochrome
MKKTLFVLSSALLIFFFFTARGMPAGNEGYAGSEACKGCHEAYATPLTKTSHWKKEVTGSPINRDGCESCHGQGAEHVDKGGGKGVAIFAFSREGPAKERSSRCLSCHEESKTLAFWNMNRHQVLDVSCDACHSIHGRATHGPVGKALLKEREPDLCFTCHKDIRAKTNRQSHHPIREGKMNCSQCHDTMGGFGPKMIKADTVNELCFKCHADKRGPFAWEHPPVSENCMYCHEVHGSNHNGLLVRKAPLLCQSCHNEGRHPATPYTSFNTFGGSATSSKNRMFARSCLNCHTNIHGSNHPALGETFVR